MSSDFEVDSMEKKPAKKTPAAPFTTSTLQQEAGRKLGYTVARTMSLAQRLYEAGKITYMRTDSLNLSETAREGAKTEIHNAYGADYAFERTFATKSKGAQEAHEAIRPTDFGTHTAGGDASEQKLYDLIWKRSIASQMSDAQVERTTIKIAGSNVKELFVAKGEVIKFEGFLKVYLEGNDDEEEEDEATEGLLPNVSKGDKLTRSLIEATQRYSRPPSRFTEASLVKKLEELGIGRPSTYAPTISTVQKRGYVHKEEKKAKQRDYLKFTLLNDELKREELSENYGAEKNKLSPTDIGMVVTDFLVEHFDKILDYNFTASVEKEFDDIAQGLKTWKEMIASFYNPFHERIEDTLENGERSSGERALGNHPESGLPVIARLGRYGAMVQIGNADTLPEDVKPKFASITGDLSLQSITLEEALELFKLPRSIGEFEGHEVTVAVGRFGPYVRYNNKFVSLKKDEGDDPMTITMDRAEVLIKEKIEADKNKYIKTFPENENVQVLNGRYGPYIKIGKKNVKIPKSYEGEPADLTLEQCIEFEKIMLENKKKPKAKAKPKAKKK